MKEKIEFVFNTLQQLDIRPTVGNTQKMMRCFATLQELYAFIDSYEKEVSEDGNDSTDNGE